MDCKTLNDWRDDAHRIAREHGFKDASIGEDVALMHSELSELLEDHRRGEPPTKVWYEEVVPLVLNGETIVIDGKGKAITRTLRHETMFGPAGSTDLDRPRKPCGIPSELADVIIRALHFAGKHGIDIEKAVEEKMRFNATRPFKHGKKL